MRTRFLGLFCAWLAVAGCSKGSAPGEPPGAASPKATAPVVPPAPAATPPNPAAPPSSAAGGADKHYTLWSESPTEVHSGKTSRFQIVLEPKGAFHINQEF